MNGRRLVSEMHTDVLAEKRTRECVMEIRTAAVSRNAYMSVSLYWVDYMPGLIFDSC